MSTQKDSLVKAIIKRTHRVPQSLFSSTGYTEGESVSRQLDVALISEGFKASAALLEYISKSHPAESLDLCNTIIDSVKELIGDNKDHNVYFKDFPKNVPDTVWFWTQLVIKTYGEDNTEEWSGNLLELDQYGKYQHTYEEMVKAHEEFIPSGENKYTVLHLGKTLPEEARKLYLSLSESRVPLNGDDLELLKTLAELCIGDEQPSSIPVRENKAVINAVRLKGGKQLMVDTSTDVLRLAAYLSGGDVTLQTKTKFKTFSRPYRKALLAALDTVNSSKLADVNQYKEQFKRLAERLHPYSYPYKNAQSAFDIAYGKQKSPSFNSMVEKAFAEKDIPNVVKLMSNAPGVFVRNFNRVLLQSPVKDLPTVTKALEDVAPKVSTNVLVSLRQYLENRTEQKTSRVFLNRKGTGKVLPDEQPVLNQDLLSEIIKVIDNEVSIRIPGATYIINRAVLDVALPMSNKLKSTGFGVLPRGSVDTFHGEILRFFTYWKEHSNRSDYDLSAILLDENFKDAGHLSYTNLEMAGCVHSGDITSAPQGASEFIDLDVNQVNAKYIVPQVNIFAGEDFNTVEESFFGYMERTANEKGKPFEAQTVKTKSELRGNNRVALPLVFIKEDDGTWTIKWLNLFLKGHMNFNATENNTLNTASLVRAVVENKYLTLRYIVGLIEAKEGASIIWEDEADFEQLKDDKDKIYIGKEVPENLPENIEALTLANLQEIY